MTIKIVRGPRVVPPIILCYGTDKIGKSSFAAGLEYGNREPVADHAPLFLSTGDEVEQIGADRTEPLRSTQAVHEALVYAASDEAKAYNTIVVDHLSDVERLIHDEVAKAAGVASVGEIGYGKGYLQAFSYWEALWRDVEAVRASGKVVVLLAHAKVVRFEPPDGEGYDVHSPEIHTNSRGEGAGTFLRKKVDVIGFATEETFTRSTGEGPQRRTKAAGSGRRVLRLVGKPSCVAGNRYGLPESIDLSWRAFVDAFTAATSRAKAAE